MENLQTSRKHQQHMQAVYPDYRISPALSLGFVVGYDDHGFEVWRSFEVGQVVVSQIGRLYRVAAFTLDNTIMAAPHGLGHDPALRAVEFEPAGLDHLPAPEPVLMHKDGLVAFSA